MVRDSLMTSHANHNERGKVDRVRIPSMQIWLTSTLVSEFRIDPRRVVTLPNATISGLGRLRQRRRCRQQDAMPYVLSFNEIERLLMRIGPTKSPLSSDTGPPFDHSHEQTQDAEQIHSVPCYYPDNIGPRAFFYLSAVTQTNQSPK
jgi:hypothetical protein